MHRRFSSPKCTSCPLPQVSSVQMCDVVHEIELEKQQCENGTVENATSGHALKHTFPLYDCLRQAGLFRANTGQGFFRDWADWQSDQRQYYRKTCRMVASSKPERTATTHTENQTQVSCSVPVVTFPNHRTVAVFAPSQTEFYIQSSHSVYSLTKFAHLSSSLEYLWINGWIFV